MSEKRTNKDIARDLGVAPTDTEQLRRKLGIKTMAEHQEDKVWAEKLSSEKKRINAQGEENIETVHKQDLDRQKPFKRIVEEDEIEAA